MSAATPPTLPDLLEQLSAVARSDVGDYLEINPDGSPCLDMRRARGAGTLRLIRRLRVERVGFSLELYDRPLALALLLRLHELMEARSAIRGASTSRPASRFLKFRRRRSVGSCRPSRDEIGGG